MLEREFEYFQEHQKEFNEKYWGKVIVIKNLQVIGVHDSYIDAVEETSKDEELGTFLVQDVPMQVMIFHSRVA